MLRWTRVQTIASYAEPMRENRERASHKLFDGAEFAKVCEMMDLEALAVDRVIGVTSMDDVPAGSTCGANSSPSLLFDNSILPRREVLRRTVTDIQVLVDNMGTMFYASFDRQLAQSMGGWRSGTSLGVSLMVDKIYATIPMDTVREATYLPLIRRRTFSERKTNC